MATLATVAEREALVAARRVETLATDAARAAAIAATGAAGLPGLSESNRKHLVASLRGGLTWAAACTALTSGKDPKLAPNAATLARWRASIEAAAAQ